MEVALQKLNRGLKHQVEEATQMRVRQERLLARHARLAAMGEMIGAIAHQWRQPLATLGATIQSIRIASELGFLDDAFMEKVEADAQKQLYYMSDTIEDFRNFFTLEKVVETFDVREKIADVMLLVSSQFANSGIALEMTDGAPERALEIRGYQNEFKQALLNLISNAFDAVRERECRGMEPASAGLVTVDVSCDGDRVVVAVRDNGCGIPPQYAERVFDPYFTSKPAEVGTGLGLYMTKLIVEESMGGRISFSSGAQGTVFSMEIRLDPAEEKKSNG